MRITRLVLDNFGPFAGRVFDNLPAGLTIFHGPNEAGKSALRAFIRVVFFGFPPARPAAEFEMYNYPPEQGGPASGSISFDTRAGRSYAIRREPGARGGKLTVSGDQTGGEELLHELTGGITADFCQSVFSVSLSDLQPNRLEVVKDRIFSVGLGVSGASLPDVTKQLEQEIRQLRGARSAGATHEAERRLSEARGELERRRAEAAGYDVLRRQIEETDQHLEELSGGLNKMRVEHERCGRMIRLWPHHQRRLELLRRLDELPPEDGFPERPLERLDGLEAQTTALAQQIEAGDLQQADRRRQMDRAHVTPAFTERSAAIQQLLGEVAQYEQAVADLPEVGREQSDRQEELAVSLEALGPVWDEGRIDGISEAGMSAIAQTLRQSGTALAQAEQEERETASQAEAERRAADAARRKADEARLAVDTQPVPVGETVDQIEASMDGLRRLREAIAEQVEKERELREVERQLAIDAAAGARRTAMSPATVILWLAVAVLGAALIAWGLMSGQPVGLAAGVAAVALAAASLVTHRLAAERASASNAGADTSPAAMLATQQNDLASRLQQVREEIAGLLPALGRTEAPDAREAEALASELDDRLRRRRESDALLGRSADAAREAADAGQKAGEAVAAHGEAAGRLAEAGSAWREALRSAGFNEDLDSGGALVAVGEVRRLKNLLREVKRLRARTADMRKKITDVEERLASVLAAAGLPPFQTGQATGALKDLQERFDDHGTAIGQRSALGPEIARWNDERAALERRMDEAIHEIENLFRKTGTVDAGEYRGLAGLVEERRELQGRLESLEEGQPDLVAAGSRPLIAEMERSTPDELAAEQQRLDGEAERLEEEIRLSREALWELQRRRKELEDANATDDVQQEIHRLSDSLRGDAGRWAVLTIARTLLERTKEEFQRERQPQLLTMASNYFARITDQRYAQVRTVVGEDRFEVVERTTRVKQVSELSRGTSEQLYLALRFAFIEDYARNAEPMPVIIDDGMVNFDPVRAQAACAATVELAKRFQVFILTCQPYTVDYFKDCTDDLNVVEL